MKIKLGPLVAAASGTIGGCTIASTTQGVVMRRAQRKTRTPTFAQQQQRARFATAARLWTESDNEERASLNTGATQIINPDRLGTPIAMTGRQLLMSVAALYRGIVPANVDIVLANVQRPFFNYCTTIWNGTTITTYYDQATGQNDGKVYIWAMRSFSQGGIRSLLWTFLDIYDYSGTDSIDLTSTFFAKLGEPHINEALAFRYVAWGDTQLPSSPKIQKLRNTT